MLSVNELFKAVCKSFRQGLLKSFQPLIAKSFDSSKVKSFKLVCDYS